MPQLLTFPLLGYFGGLPLTHLLLWSGLVVLTILVIVVVATRWGRSRPLNLRHTLLASALPIGLPGNHRANCGRF